MLSLGLGLGLNLPRGSGNLLDAVTGLQATVNGDRTVTLDWTDAADAPSGYRVYRQTLDQSGIAVDAYTLQDSVSQGVETFDDPFPEFVVTIPLAGARFDGGSGVTTTSNGILLPQGLLTEAQLSLVAFWNNGAEASCYVAKLEGTWPDGSLQAILHQASVDPDALVNAQLRIGIPAAQARLSVAAAEIKVVPDAILMPSAAADFLDSGVFPRTVSKAATPATFAAYDSVWEGWETLRRGGASPVSHKWDRPMAAFGHLIRRGLNSTSKNYFEWACDNVEQIIAEADALSPDGSTAPQNLSLECLPYHYWLTGFARSREYAGIYAQRNDHSGSSTGPNSAIYYPDPRIWHREVLGVVQAIRCNSTGHYDADAGSWPNLTRAQRVTKLNAMIDLVLTAQIAEPNPNAGLWYYSPLVLAGDAISISECTHYMSALICDAMAQACDFLAADVGSARIADVVAAVEAYCNSIWRYYDPTAKAIQYNSDDSEVVDPDDSQVPTTALQIVPFGWAYRKTLDASYKTMGDALMQALCDRMDTTPYLEYGVGGDYQSDEQAFNECFTSSWRYLGERVA